MANEVGQFSVGSEPCYVAEVEGLPAEDVTKEDLDVLFCESSVQLHEDAGYHAGDCVHWQNSYAEQTFPLRPAKCTVLCVQEDTSWFHLLVPNRPRTLNPKP